MKTLFHVYCLYKTAASQLSTKINQHNGSLSLQILFPFSNQWPPFVAQNLEGFYIITASFD